MQLVFSEAGFRLECVEPLFHLVSGFMDQFVQLSMGDKKIEKLTGKSALGMGLERD